jgi:hypothetical protein
MKRIADLTPSDLGRVAVWHYLGEHDDVALLRATDRTELTEDDEEIFIARTQFHLASGAQYLGFCSPSDDAALGSLQPVIVTPDGPVFFYFDQPPSSETLDRQWSRLGASADAIFPIHFRCTVPLDGNFITGTIAATDLTGAA